MTPSKLNSKPEISRKQDDISQEFEMLNVVQHEPMEKQNWGVNLASTDDGSELQKSALNQFIIKDMNLDSKVFFQEAASDDTKEEGYKPTVADLIASQR